VYCRTMERSLTPREKNSPNLQKKRRTRPEKKGSKRTRKDLEKEGERGTIADQKKVKTGRVTPVTNLKTKPVVRGKV